MASESANGIILRTRPLTESSLIVHWLTAGLGRISTVAKGAKRPKSPYRGRLDLLFEGEFSFVRSRRSSLHTLTEVRTGQPHPEVRTRLPILEQVAFWIRVLELATETESPLPEIHGNFQLYLKCLSDPTLADSSFCLFGWKFMEDMGLAPDPRLCFPKTDPRKELLERLLSLGWRQLGQLETMESTLHALREWITHYAEQEFGPVKARIKHPTRLGC